MTVGRIQDNGVHAGLRKGFYAVQDVGGNAHSSGNYEALGFDRGHFFGLFFGGHILVDHAYSAFACHGSGHPAFGDGIHGGRSKGTLQGDVTGESAFKGHLAGKDLGVGGDQEDVVEGDAFLHYAVFEAHPSVT